MMLWTEGQEGRDGGTIVLETVIEKEARDRMNFLDGG